MRVTAFDSEHYWGRRFSSSPTILLDGVVQRFVIEADDVEGVIRRNKVDEAGWLCIDGCEFVVEELRGTVQIIGQQYGSSGNADV